MPRERLEKYMLVVQEVTLHKFNKNKISGRERERVNIVQQRCVVLKADSTLWIRKQASKSHNVHIRRVAVACLEHTVFLTTGHSF